MTDIDFYLDFLDKGFICNESLQSPPNAWTQRLGEKYIDDTKKGNKRIDYGLIELSFWRDKGTWRCNNVAVQVQRLRHGNNSIPPILENSYGRFSSFILFSEIKKELNSHKIEYDLINDKNRSDYERYYVPKSQVIIHAIPTKYDGSDDSLKAGSIWSMSLASNNSAVWSRPF